MRINLFFICLICFSAFNVQTVTAQDEASATHFTNPIAKGADPWVTKHDGYYYMCAVGGKNGNTLTVTKSKTLTEPGERVTVWETPDEGWNQNCLWAPELHRIGDKWYIYYAAGKSGPPYIYQRSGVLESVSDDPQGEYIDRGILKTGDDPNDYVNTIWAIDVTPLELNGQLYAVWSGWEKNEETDATKQHLYIAEMSNPYTISSERVKISSPEESWETGGPLDLNEGAQVLQREGQTFIIYSTRESWLENYRLGQLRLIDPSKSPLDPTNWEKKGPVFMGTEQVHGTGHASFTKSPDDSEWWIVYHSKRTLEPGWDRDVRTQKFTWNEKGEPVFGKPIPTGVRMKRPSGEAEIIQHQHSDKGRATVGNNPLPVAFGDPYVMKDSDGTYYMYGTGGGAKKGFAAYSSTNLEDWKFEGQVYHSDNKNGWGIDAFWAPEVYHRNGKYYLFYSAQWKVNPNNELENFKIGVAVSDNPTGPFIDMYDRPIFDPGYPIIDANVWFEDGKVYLYYSRCCYKHPVESEISAWAREKGWYDEIEESWVYGIEMKPDFSGVIGEPELLLRPPLELDVHPWESRSVTAREANRRWTEGSYIFKKNDVYYMMYSANFFGGQNYAVGYATSKSPLGPFEKAAENPILQKNGKVTGTGHNSITFSPDGDSMLCVYHGRTAKTGDERLVFIDRMEVNEKGEIVVHGPTLAE